MLKFVCPQCRGTKLDLIKIDVELIYPVLEINEDNDFVYDEPIVNEFNDGSIWGMQCPKCDFIIRGEDGQHLIDQKDIRNWIIENCEQK